MLLLIKLGTVDVFPSRFMQTNYKHRVSEDKDN